MGEVINRYDVQGYPAWMAEEADGGWVKYTDHAEAMREKEAEIQRYRQAIWDARSILGFDNDGDPTPGSVTYPHLADLLRRDATEFRSDYDAAIREIVTDENNLAEAMRTIAEHDGDMQAMESLASEHKESAERAEAQRDALIACARMALDEPEATHDWMPAFRRALGLDTANKPL